MRLVIVGGGNMGGAILSALVMAKAVSPENILLIEPDEEKRVSLSKATGCLTQTEID